MDIKDGDTIKLLEDVNSILIKGEILTCYASIFNADEIWAMNKDRSESAYLKRSGIGKVFELWGQVTGQSAQCPIVSGIALGLMGQNGEYLTLNLNPQNVKTGDIVTNMGCKAKILSIKESYGLLEALLEYDTGNQGVAYLRHLHLYVEPETPKQNWDGVCNDLWDKYTLD